MLNDLSMAHDQSKLYEQHLQETSALSTSTSSVDFHVMILTSSHWPSYKHFSDLEIPRELMQPMQSFTQYYQGKHNHRLLKWCYSLGSATVSARFAKTERVFDCVVGTFQMCIIMLFNSTGPQGYQITYKAIKQALKMDDDTLQKNLKSLMLKNFKLLEIRGTVTPPPTEAAATGKMTPSGIQLRDDTIIGVNEAFVSPLNRIVFPTPVLEEVYKKGKKPEG